MTPKALRLWRLERGTTRVPDDAPRHLHWRTIDAAMEGVAAWARAEHAAGRYGGATPPWVTNDDVRRVKPGWSIEYRLARAEVTTDPERQVVVVASWWEWRLFRMEQHKVSAVVDGVELAGWSTPTRVEETEWSADPFKRSGSWERPVSMERRDHIPFEAKTIEFGEGVVYPLTEPKP